MNKNYNNLSLARFSSVKVQVGARSNVVVKALCYKLEGRGFDTR
jgi:hypothetical protein